MEEDIRKRGMLYLQQQRFGKKWRKVWTILYKESTCSISRLEFFECKDHSGTLEKSNRKQDNKKVIKLSDCIRVTCEVDVEGCPRDCGPLLVETSEKQFVFAAENAEVEDWKKKLCEIAFPVSTRWTERGQRRGSMQHTQAESDEVTMADNSIYSGREGAMKDFRVTIRRTEASERCNLRGAHLLRTDFDSLLLKDPKTGEVVYTWPYRFLRRFGRDKTTFSFEAGRRCDSGEGNFEFETKLGNEIFQCVEAAINVQKTSLSHRQFSAGGCLERDPPRINTPADDGGAYSTVNEMTSRETPLTPQPPRSRLETPSDKHLTGVKSLTLDTRPPPRKSQVKNFRSCPLANSESDMYCKATMPVSDQGSLGEQVEPESKNSPSSNHSDPDYALPFDTIAKNLAEMLSVSHPPPAVADPGCKRERAEEDSKLTEPLYDSIDEMAIRTPLAQKSKSRPSTYSRAEHIYDEPEGCAVAGVAPTFLYDDPEEVKGHAWKIRGNAADPSGHEYPYNPQVDDYAVPKPPRRAFASEQKQKDQATIEEDDSSPYDNVMLKMV
ncbi:docking protein 2 [Chanos chanos]|uniref:Docking protein 2 n=1 Tax=Chanos chanos TaxID=29144 RepID=A0A6J2WMJ7_CHACN|nr:docking protein 2-like [Chanos chanos]